MDKSFVGNVRKFVFFLILALCVFVCGCNEKPKTIIEKIQERDVLTVGVKSDSKPFGYVENGQFKGFDIDIAKKIAQNILDDETKVKFVPVTSENRISKLLAEEVDLIIATMTDTPERREIIDFSEPYYISGQAVMCKKNSEVSSIADLANHNTIIVSGTTAESTLLRYYNRTNILRAKTYKEGFNLIDKDSCMIADDAILQGFLMDYSGYEIYNKKLSTEPYAVAVRKEDTELKRYADATIKHLEEDGELEKIKNKWIK